ncbi:uncharacterized [Tachysurus ichikawai]
MITSSDMPVALDECQGGLFVLLASWNPDFKCQLSWECRRKAAFFSGLFAQRLSERSSPGRMKCRDTNNVLRKEWKSGNEQFGLFAQQKASHNGMPAAFP